MKKQQNRINSAGISDKPKFQISEDLFSIQNYVEGLSSFIAVCQTPMTISIQGDWGSGKTSFMYMVKQKLTEQDIYTIELNTWQFSQFSLGEKLPVLILSKLIKELGAKKDTDFWKYVQIILDISETANVPILSNTATIFNKYFGEKDGTDLTDLITKLKMSFEDIVKERIKADALKLNKTEDKGDTFNYSGRRIVIFIDDLDRLEPSKALELLEVFKIFLDCEHIVFVLAIDYEVIVQGVQEKYKLDQDKGKNFFDKIIQLPFKMPISQFDIDSYLMSSFKEIGVHFENQNDIKKYNKLISSSISYNPRAMKRLFNSYQLLLIINKNNNLSNINNHQMILFMVLCMQIAYESVYNYISSSGNFNEAQKLLEFVSDQLIDASNVENENENLDEISPKELIINKLSDLELITQGTNIVALLKFLEIFLEFLAEDPNDLSTADYKSLFEIFKVASITQRSENHQTSRYNRTSSEFKNYQELPINYEIVNNGDLKNWDSSKVRAIKIEGDSIEIRNHTQAFLNVLKYLYNKHTEAFEMMMEEAKNNIEMKVIRSIFFESKLGKPLVGMFKIPDIEKDIKVGTKTNAWYKIDQLLNVCDYLKVDPGTIYYDISLIDKPSK